jgi:hypothetical protein
VSPHQTDQTSEDQFSTELNHLPVPVLFVVASDHKGIQLQRVLVFVQYLLSDPIHGKEQGDGEADGPQQYKEAATAPA